MSITIREENESDILEIYKVTEEAFKDVELSDKTEPLIVSALRKAGKLTVSLVAEENGSVVGHVAVSPVSISDGTKGWYGLGPISVIPKMQGRGIGSELMKAALFKLEEIGASGCVVLGEPDYYRRFGFEANSRLVFPGVPAEYFMSLSFNSDFPEGEVIYHESFYGRV
jgi:putative acetyltransferase